MTQMPDKISAWWFLAEKQDDVMQGGWTQHLEPREALYLAATPAREAADAMLFALEELHADCIARADKNGVVPIGRGAFMMLEAAMSKARGQGQ